jgi:hypothetical protein
MAMTVDSARRYRAGRGATWKGRALAGVGGSPPAGAGGRA